jgi:uncharacterized membrane protein
VSQKSRYLFVDQLRGLIIALMGLDHASNYFNSIWNRVEYNNFILDSPGQFTIRYLSYLCAPGFLMLAGAMLPMAFDRRLKEGVPAGKARASLALRGFFLVLVQLIWVNASWGAFERLRIDHFGIIATIGASLMLLALVVDWRWQARLGLGLAIFLVHPLLLRIPYDPASMGLGSRVMQLFVDSTEWNLYPILPWFGLSVMGTLAGDLWFRRGLNHDLRLERSLYAGLAAVALFFIVRVGNAYGNLLPYDHVGSVSFFMEQKYPPSLAHNFFFFGTTLLLAAFFMGIGGRLRWLFHPLEVYGRTPFFFYVIHIPLLAFLTKRTGLLPYREGGVGTALLAWVALLIVMYPLCLWFGRVKARSKSALIKMM